MKKRILLLTLIMCLLGGVNLKTLNAQDVVTIDGNGNNSSQYGEKGLFETYQTTTSSSQSIYTKEEIGISAGSTITHLAFKIDNTENTSRTIVVWLRNINEVDFGENINKGLIQMSNEYKVFEGNFDLRQSGWISIDIDDFVYTGASLLVTVYDKTGVIGEGDVKFNMFYSYINEGNSYWYKTLFKKNADPSTATLLNGAKYTPSIQITYSSGSSTPTAPDAPKLGSPENGATGIFNPSLNFTLGNHTEHYQILMGEGTNEMTAVTGWVEKTNNTVSYQTNNLKSNTAYSWKVVAKNDVGETTSEVYTFTTRNITAAPGAISGITPANGAEVDSDPQLSWTFGENTESYKVCLSVEDGDWEIVRDWTNTNNALTASFNTASLNDGDGLDANQTYNWQILTKNSFGENGGDVYSFTKVGAPGNVTPISPADGATEVSNTATLSWRFAPHTEEYRVLMDLGYGFEYVTTWIETDGETATYTPEGIGGGKTVRWCVEVSNASASLELFDADQENNPAEFTYTTSTFLPVKNISPVNDSRLDGETATLEWNFQGDATHYQVKLGKDRDKMDVVLDWTERGEVGTGELVTEGIFETEELDHNSRYYWQVNVKKTEDAVDMFKEGEIASFITILDNPQNVTTEKQYLYSEDNGVARISWDDPMSDIEGLNIYVGTETEPANAELIPAKQESYDVTVPTIITDPQTITVKAVYAGLGESTGSTTQVEVVGYATVNGTITDDKNQQPVEGVTVTYSGTDDFGKTHTIVFTTGADGKYSGTVPEGTYSITAVKEDYLEHSAVARYFGNGETMEETITLVNKLAFHIGIDTNTAMELGFHLTNAAWYGLFDAPEGNFTIYLRKENEVVEEYGPVDFIYMNLVNALYMSQEHNILEFNSRWANLPNGTYNVGVAIYGKNYINWSEDIPRNYHIFTASNNNNDWNDELNWFGGLPGATDDVTLRASVVVAEASDITVANVMIEGSAALTINGTLNANDVTITKDASLVINGILNANDVTITKDASLVINGILKANDVINQGVFGKLLINDGGQLYRTATTLLRGKFVKNIKKPTNWETTKDGWQLMASPFTNEDGTYTYFTQFTNVATGDYDLYNYNGSALKEWINIKDTETNGDTFGTTFVNGTGYLVAHESAREVALTGTFKSGTSYTIGNLIYNAEKDLANFHLLGNPFPFNMDWSNVKGNRLVEGFAVLNEDGNNYVYKTSGTIKVGEGFFIRTRAAEGTEGDPSFTHSITRGAEKETVNSLNVIATGNVGKDNVVINFAGESEGFPKLQNFNDAIATVYVQDKGAKYGIYNCDENTTEVELCFNANQMGNYTISVEDSEEFETVILVDRFTGIETNMLLEDYTFTAMSDVNNNRFILKLAVSDQQSAVSDNFVYQSGEELIVEAEGTVQIIDMMGRVVYNNDVTSDNNRIDVSGFRNGTYVVRVINESEIKVEKVVIY